MKLKRNGIAIWLAFGAVLQAYAQGGASPASPTSSTSSTSSTPSERRNWYGDPFVQLSNAFASCPVPLGPWITYTQMQEEAHYRVEQGTSCWLAHRCSKPNSYLYDKPIAAAARAQFAGDRTLAGTSLWITVQRRFIYAEGCAGPSFDRAALQRRLAALPDVEQVVVRITGDPRGPLPYKTPAHPD